MPLYFIEPDGKTVKSIKLPHDEDPNMDMSRVFQVHPEHNPLFRRDSATGRFVYEFNGVVKNM